MELICSVQKYEWGKPGRKSLVATLAANSGHTDNIQDEPYAELWMGCHPNGPSKIKATSQSLDEFVAENPQTLGTAVKELFGNNLPFLFKVLSVDKALSIQAHPSKQHAEELHEEFPSVYKDSNHKPEIAIALTDFEALCGFRPTNEILTFIKRFPELEELIQSRSIEQLLIGDIRGSFQDLMLCNSQVIKEAICKILSRNDSCLECKLAERLNEQFPDDIGVLCVFWLNYVPLKPGEALFLAPNEPHAYLSGECIENMANSDNVVRAGLTPKFRDVRTLCNMLTYKSYTPTEIKFQPEEEDEKVTLYKPPVKDFAVARMQLSTGEHCSFKPIDSASIVLNVSGTCTASSNFGSLNSQSGTVLFLPAGEALDVIASTDLVLFRAYCNIPTN